MHIYQKSIMHLFETTLMPMHWCHFCTENVRSCKIKLLTKLMIVKVKTFEGRSQTLWKNLCNLWKSIPVFQRRTVLFTFSWRCNLFIWRIAKRHKLWCSNGRQTYQHISMYWRPIVLYFCTNNWCSNIKKEKCNYSRHWNRLTH
jgi:hypothetical protein